MSARTNIQILKDPAGHPAFAVIPYAEYLSLSGQQSKPTIPNEVVGKVVLDGVSPLRAWREYLGLTQAEVAQRLGISQPAYAVQENSEKLRKTSRARIAQALGVAFEQIDF